MHMFGGEAGDMRFPISCVIGQLCSVAAEYLRVDSQLALGSDETRDDSRGTALARSDSLDYVQYSQHPLTGMAGRTAVDSIRSMTCGNG
jgi:hypothetical protein